MQSPCLLIVHFLYKIYKTIFAFLISVLSLILFLFFSLLFFSQFGLLFFFYCLEITQFVTVCYRIFHLLYVYLPLSLYF